MDCPECRRLADALDAIVKRNTALLKDYTPAALNRDESKVEIIAKSLREIEARRREARLKLMSHQSTHDRASAASNEGIPNVVES